MTWNDLDLQIKDHWSSLPISLAIIDFCWRVSQLSYPLNQNDQLQLRLVKDHGQHRVLTKFRISTHRAQGNQVHSYIAKCLEVWKFTVILFNVCMYVWLSWSFGLYWSKRSCLNLDLSLTHESMRFEYYHDPWALIHVFHVLINLWPFSPKSVQNDQAHVDHLMNGYLPSFDNVKTEFVILTRKCYEKTFICAINWIFKMFQNYYK